MEVAKQTKTDDAIALLKGRLHLVEVKKNGHIRVNGCDFWCTSEKFYNPKTDQRGTGLRNFIKMIEETN